jgi:hypothetical protein
MTNEEKRNFDRAVAEYVAECTRRAHKRGIIAALIILGAILLMVILYSI